MLKKWKMLLCSVVFVCAACKSTDSDVVGRSSQNRPTWVDDVTGIESTPELVYLTYKKTNVIRAELGIKQAQAEAQAATKTLVANRVVSELSLLLKDNFAANKVVLAQKIKDQVPKIVEKIELAEANPVSTYLEEIRSGQETGASVSYEVYVLLATPREFIDEGIRNCAEQFSGSSDAGLAAFGQHLIKLFRQEE